MLFFRGIEREFSRASFNRGQAYFRQHRVQNVKRNGGLVSGQVRGSAHDAYYTAIVVDRGKIMNSKCSCPAHRQYETHCKHVAALTIWICQRARRMGWKIDMNPDAELPDRELILTDPKNASFDSRLKKLITAHPEISEGAFMLRRDRLAAQILGKRANGQSYAIPITMPEAHALAAYCAEEAVVTTPLKQVPAVPIAYLRGQLQGRVFLGISIEPALSFTDPQTRTGRAELVSKLAYDWSHEAWKTDDGLHLKPAQTSLPVVESLNAPPLQYSGQSGLELLGDILNSPDSPARKQLVIHPSVALDIHPEPLKLASVRVGKKADSGRELTYRYEATGVSFPSDELIMLAGLGHVSPNYVWKDNRIYRFETPLTIFSRFVSRNGAAETNGEANGDAPAFKMDGLGHLFEDSANPLHPLAVYRLSLELGVAEFSVDTDWEEFHAWKAGFEKKRDRKLPKVKYGFKLRAYQRNGLEWLWSLYDRRLSALLADDMGLGKTHQVLALLSSYYLSKTNRPKLPSLVIAPTSVVSAWAQKLKKYKTGLNWHVYHGKGRILPGESVRGKRGKPKIDLVLTSYGILQREASLIEREWHTVILDEAQYIKNPTTISARAARALKADYRIAMTGTPVENHAADLWSLFEFMIPGYLGPLSRFKNLYCSARGIPSEEQAKVLRRLVSPFLLRRTKNQVLKELPEKTEEVVPCEMTETQRNAYKTALQSADATKIIRSLKGKGPINFANVLALLTRLKQLCDHPNLPDLSSGKLKSVKEVDPEQSGKWETLHEIIREALDSNLKVVVFTQYLGMMDLLGTALKKENIGYTEIRGDTVDREERLGRFAEDPECKIFICSLLAGGLGIDLTSASVCVHLDRWWNPAKENQATDRLHRIGQTRGVQVFKLQIPGTVEDRIAAIIESKIELAGALIEESSAGLRTFSRKQLLDLLSLDEKTGD
jgi:superfamily II DNA or RNA helicase